jgi:ABC-2 type transport system ATP-binding protein
MGKSEDEREFDDTTVTGGGARAWSDVDRPAGGEPAITGDAPPEGYAGGPLRPRPAGADTPSDGDTEATVVVDGSWSAPQAGERDQRVTVDSGLPGDSPRAAGTPQLEGGQSALKGRRRAGKAPKEPVIPPGPVLVAVGLGLLTSNGWVFKDIALTLRPSSVAAIVGPAGTGRSCLLLALSGRMAANTGTLTVAGHAMKDKPAAVRALTSVARISSVIAPEPGLTVRQSIDERCLLDDVDTRVGRLRFTEACTAMRVTFEPTALVGSMVGDQATLLAVALACVRVSALIVLDDLDRGVSTALQQTLLDALIRLAKTGPTIVLSTTDRIPVMGADVVLDLTPTEGAAMWRLDAPLPGSHRLELDPMSQADRAALAQLEPATDESGAAATGPDDPDDESGDPHARWRPGYPGETGSAADPDPAGPGPYGSDPAASVGPDPYGSYGSYGPDEAGGGERAGQPDPRKPPGYQNQRDAPTEDPR